MALYDVHTTTVDFNAHFCQRILAAKSTGEIFIFMGDRDSIGTNDSLWLAGSTDMGATWNAVDMSDFIGETPDVIGTAILIDSDDAIHLLWTDFSGPSAVLNYTNSYDYSTIIEVLNTGVGLGVGAAIGANDEIHIIVSSTTPSKKVTYRKRTAGRTGTWQTAETVSTTYAYGIYSCAVVVDNTGNIHALYRDEPTSGTFEIRHCIRAGSWGTETLVAGSLTATAIISLRLENEPGTDNVVAMWSQLSSGGIYAIEYRAGTWGTKRTIHATIDELAGIIINSEPRWQIFYNDGSNVKETETTSTDLASLSTAATVFSGLSNGNLYTYHNSAASDDMVALALVSGTVLKFGRTALWEVYPLSGTLIDKTRSEDLYNLDTQYPTIGSFDVNLVSLGNVDISWDWDGDTGNDVGSNFIHYQIYTSEISQATVDAKGGTAQAPITNRTVETFSTTVTPGNTLYVAMFPKDKYGNEPPGGTYADDSLSKPIISTVSPIQTDELNGYVTITVTLIDLDGDTVKVKAEYNTNGTTSGTKCTLVGSVLDSIAPDQANVPDIDNAEAYQIGKTYQVVTLTNGTENVLIFKWDSETDVGIVNEDYYILITALDASGKVSDIKISSAFTLDSRPIKPDAPTIVNKSDTTLNVTQPPTADEPGTLEYAIHIEGGVVSGFVQSGGSVGASEYWDDSTFWTNKQITGLVKLTEYSLYSKSRYSAALSLESDLSEAIIESTASLTPVVTNYAITLPTDGSKNYVLDYDLSDADSEKVTVSFEYWDGIQYNPMVSVTGAVGVLTGITGTLQSFVATWFAGGNANNLDIAAANIRISVDDGTQVYTQTLASTFVLDTSNPFFDAGTVIKIAVITNTTLKITWSNAANAAEINFDNYEIYYSTLSQADANSKIESVTNKLWNDVDDVALATISTKETTITGLTHNTTYYLAFFAKDTYGNRSILVEMGDRTLRDYKIEGYALDQYGYKIVGANIYLYPKLSGILKDSTVTDANGYYSFIVNDELEYYIVVEHDNYLPGIEDKILGVGL